MESVEDFYKDWVKPKLDIDERIKNGELCHYCRGHGIVQDGGMFSQFYKCDVCDGKGKPKKNKK